MNWLAFFILAYLAVGLQAGLSSFMRWGSPASAGAEPNFGLVAVVFVSLNAERQAALLGGFVIGSRQDLATQQPFGLFAFCFGLAALGIVSIATSGDHPASQRPFSPRRRPHRRHLWQRRLYRPARTVPDRRIAPDQRPVPF
jgi:hypothetical protein